MNNQDLKAKFNDYYCLAREIIYNIKKTEDIEFKDILMITDILVKIDSLVDSK